MWDFSNTIHQWKGSWAFMGWMCPTFFKGLCYVPGEGGGYCHWLQYAYARTARVSIWHIMLWLSIWFSQAKIEKMTFSTGLGPLNIKQEKRTWKPNRNGLSCNSGNYCMSTIYSAVIRWINNCPQECLYCNDVWISNGANKRARKCLSWDYTAVHEAEILSWSKSEVAILGYLSKKYHFSH